MFDRKEKKESGSDDYDLTVERADASSAPVEGDGVFGPASDGKGPK